MIQHNNYILRLKAGCLYSEGQWEQLKTTFLSALGNITNTSPYSIHCKCGGFCKLSADNNGYALLDQVGKQEFSAFYNVEAIPAGLTRYLQEKEGYSLQMVAPGEGYNKSDLVVKGFPDKRLIFGANGSLGVNLLVYQFRRSALPFCLVYKRLSKKAYRLLFLRLFSDIQDIKPLLHAIQTKQYMLR